mgnify:CR=1 FL=1
MLDEQVKDVIQKFDLKDNRAVTFGHPKMKMKWVLTLVGATIYSVEQFQPFFIYFDKSGISFFPLDLNNKYQVMGKSFISWNDVTNFKMKNGLLKNEMQIETQSMKIEMKTNKIVANNSWVKDNINYLKERNYFYNK